MIQGSTSLVQTMISSTMAGFKWLYEEQKGAQMEGMLSASDKQSMVSSFLEIAVGQTAETAMQFLQVPFSSLTIFLHLYHKV